jgi:tripartite-type tricarboxylate transporter receptor subunit TctC
MHRRGVSALAHQALRLPRRKNQNHRRTTMRGTTGRSITGPSTARPGPTRRGLGLALAAALPLPALAQAETWPSRPIRIIVPYTPGGGTDIIARLMAEALAGPLGQPVAVENRGGGLSVPGTQAAITAAPDGYTLGIVDNSLMTNLPLLGARLPYDPRRDLTPVSLIAATPAVLAVRADLPAADLKGLVALAKQAAEPLAYASPGAGTAMHLAMEAFRQAAGIELLQVSYRGGGNAMTSVLSGTTRLIFATVPVAVPHLRAGTLRALAVAVPQRAAQIPDVPTMAEAGFPQVESALLNGMIAPPGLPPAIRTRLEAAVATALAQPALATRMAELGYRPIGSDGAEYGRVIAAEIARWTEVIRAGGIVVE